MVVNLHAQARKQKLAHVRESKQSSVWDQAIDYIVDVEGLESLTKPKRRTAQVLEFNRRQK